MFTNNTPVRRMVTVWADAEQPVTRRVYVTHGLVLATAKYLGDALLIFTATGALWTPIGYVQGLPGMILAPASWIPSRPWLAAALVCWMLPFLAVGVLLTTRRAMNAGRSPWLSTLFLVPYANYVLMAALCVMPSRPRSRRPADAVSRVSDTTARIMAGATGVSLALVAVGVGVQTLLSYGAWLFVLTPFAMGACTAFFYHRLRRGDAYGTTSLVLGTLAASAVVMMLVALEGFVCLVMALPLAVPLAILGGMVGRQAAASDGRESFPGVGMLMVLPLAAIIAPADGRLLHEVRSSVVIAAPPDAVWPHVIAFPEIPAPDDWLFRAGVAYPIHARLEGSGVGAVRYCVFSTGAFVEPVTRWEPGRRLSFDVTDSPAPLRELSLYSELAPPHLHGYLRPKRGEFRLVDLGNGRTRLEGSTWYELEMAPEGYWRIFSDAMIQRIHARVLEHIKHEAERSSRT